MQPVEPLYLILARIFAVGYFVSFWPTPSYSHIDRVSPAPDRVVYHAY